MFDFILLTKFWPWITRISISIYTEKYTYNIYIEVYDSTFQIFAKSIIKITCNTHWNDHMKLLICDFCILSYLRSIVVTSIYVENRVHKIATDACH